MVREAEADGLGNNSQRNMCLLLLIACLPATFSQGDVAPYPHASLLGHAACNLGDLDGDGVADWVASAPQAFNDYDQQVGALVFFSGATDRPFRTVFGPAGHDNFGWDLWAPGDVNGDGFDDLLVGSGSDRRLCWMISGAEGETLWTARVPCLRPAWVPDVDGDGALDLLIGSGRGSVVFDRKGHSRPTGGLYGALDLLPIGDLDGEPGVEVARLRSTSLELLRVADGEGGDRALVPVGTLELPVDKYMGDVKVAIGALDSRDGGDLVVGLPGPRGETGRVLAYSGQTRELLWAVERTGPKDGEGIAGVYESDLGASLAILPDFTGDGRDEVAIGAPGTLFTGSVRVVSGADGRTLWIRKSQSLNDAEEYPGTSLDTLPDRDGDGTPELLVGGGCTRPHGNWCLSGNVQILSGSTGSVLFRIEENQLPGLRRPVGHRR